MPSHDEDIDDIMSSILQRQHGGTPPATVHSGKPKKKPKLYVQDQTYAKQKSSVFDTPAEPIRAPRRKMKLKRSFKITLLIVFVVLAIGGAGFVFREQIQTAVDDLLAPSSPFSQELKDETGFPLYYPTDLPPGFKFDTSTIKQPETGVVIYAVTDESGKTVNFTLQSQPSGLNLDPLLAVLKDIREINTPLGTAKRGIAESENREIVNLLTGKTWILVNTPAETISNEEMDALLNSLRQG